MAACFRPVVLRVDGLGLLMDAGNDQFVEAPVLVHVPGVTDFSTCAFVVQSGADYGNNFMSLSAEDGGLISAGIVSVWMAAFGIKTVIAVIKGSSTNETV